MYTSTLKQNILNNRDNLFSYYDENLSPHQFNKQEFNNHHNSSSLKPYYLNPLINDQCDDILDKLEQAGRVPSKDKFRRMACNTFICTGACPYNDRCVFMHDFRIKADGVKVRSTRQMRANTIIKDTFYWPDMTRNEICRHLDAHGLPDANQRYIIPETFASVYASHHNRGIYSIWNHFVDFCMNNSRVNEYQQPFHLDPFFQTSSNNPQNKHIHGAYRLSVFVQLSTTQDHHHIAETTYHHNSSNHNKQQYPPLSSHKAIDNMKSGNTTNTSFLSRECGVEDTTLFLSLLPEPHHSSQISQDEMKCDTTSSHVSYHSSQQPFILSNNTDSNNKTASTTSSSMLKPFLRSEAIPFTPMATTSVQTINTSGLNPLKQQSGKVLPPVLMPSEIFHSMTSSVTGHQSCSSSSEHLLDHQLLQLQGNNLSDSNNLLLFSNLSPISHHDDSSNSNFFSPDDINFWTSSCYLSENNECASTQSKHYSNNYTATGQQSILLDDGTPPTAALPCITNTDDTDTYISVEEFDILKETAAMSDEDENEKQCDSTSDDINLGATLTHAWKQHSLCSSEDNSHNHNSSSSNNCATPNIYNSTNSNSNKVIVIGSDSNIIAKMKE